MKVLTKIVALTALTTTMALPTITTFAASTTAPAQQQADCPNDAQGENGEIAHQYRYGQLDTTTGERMHRYQQGAATDTAATPTYRQAKGDGTGQMKRNGQGPKNALNDCLPQT